MLLSGKLRARNEREIRRREKRAGEVHRSLLNVLRSSLRLAVGQRPHGVAAGPQSALIAVRLCAGSPSASGGITHVVYTSRALFAR